MRSNYNRLRYLIKYLKPYKKLLFYSLILTLLYTLTNVYAMPLIRDISAQLTNKNMDHFTNHVMNALLLFTVMRLSYYGQVYTANNISNRVLLDIRTTVYEKLHQLPQSFYNQAKVGDLLTKMFDDTDRVRQLILLSFEAFLPQFLTVIGITGYLIYLSPILTLFTLVSAPLLMYVVLYFSTKLKRVLGQSQRKLSDLTQSVTENISDMKMVQSFNLEERNSDRFHNMQFRNLRLIMRQIRFKCIQEPIVAVLQFVVLLVIVWFGGYLVLNDQLSGPNLSAFFTGVLLLSDAGLRLSNSFTALHGSFASVDRFFDLIDQSNEIEEVETPEIIEHVKGGVVFSDLSFSYPDKPVLFNQFNLTVKPGETVALVGESGSGKSTLLNLLPRFYDVDSGQILIDGIDVRRLSFKQLRSIISIVPQEPFLIRGTILENIRMGKPTATFDEVYQAIDQASAHFIYDLPDKLLTKIGDRGILLSGGQKQRLSIARALLKNAQIMVLDEPTSSLDSQTEKDIQESFESLMKSRTCLVIAHRLSTIKTSDRIVVLNQGEISSIGTHEELMNSDPIYQNLYQLQFS